ncbi:putative Histidine-containing phosphotransfer protein [Melia azedarach]|uniref:Histidine-containing phosphotransfer protein n=1 Tax=Melia azedarach TaxID=155640 RepID=A0ACC1YBP2_MELAZ|nr:putative Histidine-containing phosphotransfer protein [Melia azedarach]
MTQNICEAFASPALPLPPHHSLKEIYRQKKSKFNYLFGALNQQLVDVMRVMEEEGLVDSRFRMVYSLKEANGPFFIAELIPTFCNDAQTTIRQMTQTLELPVMNFHEMEELCMKIKGGTSCIGAHQMALACGDLRQAIDDKSKERCIVAVDALRHEYLKLQTKMDVLLQLERRIISHN